jgi:CRP/FNR family transcriptional regulator, cyclic AMP receptor protein
MSQKTDLLRHVPLFAACGGKQLDAIGQLADEIDVPAGTTLMKEGERGGEFFVIVDGTVRVEKGGTTLRTMHAGEFLGEIALVDGGPRTATAITETPSRLLVVAHREFHTLMQDHPAISMAVLEALAQRVRNVDGGSH